MNCKFWIVVSDGRFLQTTQKQAHAQELKELFFASSDRKEYLTFEIKFMILEVEKNAISEVPSGYARLVHGALANGGIMSPVP